MPMSPMEFVILAMLIALGFFLINRGRRTSQARPSNPAPEAEHVVRTIVQEMEMRLVTQMREFEARVDNRLRVLDQLTARADAACERLEAQLPAGESGPR